MENSTVKVTFEDSGVVLEQLGPDGKLLSVNRWVEIPFHQVPNLAQQLHQQGGEYARVKVAGWRVLGALFVAQVKEMFGIKGKG